MFGQSFIPAVCFHIVKNIDGENSSPWFTQKELEEKFQEVKQFIKDNPGNNINQVSDACEVPVKQIKKWVREERLEFSSGVDIGVTCENCGAPITSGRFCAKCKSSMINDQCSNLKPKAPTDTFPFLEIQKMGHILVNQNQWNYIYVNNSKWNFWVIIQWNVLKFINGLIMLLLKFQWLQIL